MVIDIRVILPPGDGGEAGLQRLTAMALNMFATRLRRETVGASGHHDFDIGLETNAFNTQRVRVVWSTSEHGTEYPRDISADWSAEELSAIREAPRPPLVFNTLRHLTDLERVNDAPSLRGLGEFLADALTRPAAVQLEPEPEWSLGVWTGGVTPVVTSPADPQPEERRGPWYRNFYRHCDTTWDGEWSSMSNDECPICSGEIEPYHSEDA